MDKFIIAISREYGSGGRHVGEALAKEFGIGFYDKEIIQLVAEKSGLSAGFIEKSDEKIQNTFLFNLKYSAYSSFDSIAYYDTPISDKVFLAQSAVIKEIAARENCVIVGRCADYILREEPGLVRVFIRAEPSDRAAHAQEHYGMPGEKILENIKKIDKSRSNYYKYYTSHQWGAMQNFDLVVNTSYTGIDGATDIIKTMLANKGLPLAGEAK